MAKRPNPATSGLTPGKTIVIGILVVVLLIVIVMQFSGKESPVARERRTRRTSGDGTQAESSASTTTSPDVAKRSENRWPTFDVAAVVASNPFALPAALTLAKDLEAGQSEEAVAAIASAEVREMRRRQSEFMASLRAVGVDMILRSPRGSVARIGDLSLRVGDVHEGLRVESIGENGVVFAPATAGDELTE